MSQADYEEARRLGKKEYKYSMSIGHSPYLPVLDEILTNESVQTEQKLGVISIPLDHVIGTATAGRTTAFASNFMPILGDSSEFAFKWAVLADAQVEEGIRDPIVAYEYMNRYYVVEGNKRVSVLKYFGAVSIQANVTRKLPKISDDPDVRIYYEYLTFHELTGINTIEFSVYGNAAALAEMIGAKKNWDPAEKEKFSSVHYKFEKYYNQYGGQKLNLKIGDAMVAFFRVYTYAAALEMTDADFANNIKKAWNEIAIEERYRVDLNAGPTEIVKKQKSIFSFFTGNSAEKKCKVAFLFPKSPEESDWSYTHELGRTYLDDTYPDTIETIRVDDVSSENVEEVLTQVTEDGATIIFEIAPQLMEPSLKFAVEHPEVTILNCSLNVPHKYIRTYYSRMYEAKFLAGMIAGALAENDRIAYIADYPIYGLIANINAFAIGAMSVNPRVKIYLDWSTKKDFNMSEFIWNNQIHIVSDQDMITPQDPYRMFGLYAYDGDGNRVNLVMPVWNWGIFYEKLIQSIMAGTFEADDQDERRPMNYWWGMSAGVVDLITSNNVPLGLRHLTEYMKKCIHSNDAYPFFDEIEDQDGNIHGKKDQPLALEEVMNMDWLVSNIIGSLPDISELIEGAQTMVALRGVES